MAYLKLHIIKTPKGEKACENVCKIVINTLIVNISSIRI